MDDHDCAMYLHLVGGVSRRMGWTCLAYCLMRNHLHLLLETPEPNLGDGMRRLHGTYAQTFNERYARTGHVFERRFNDRAVESVRSILNVATYIAANPVEAGMAARAEEWPWSSHAAVIAGDAPPWLAADRLHALLEAEGGQATQRYLEALDQRVAAVEPAAGEPERPRPS